MHCFATVRCFVDLTIIIMGRLGNEARYRAIVQCRLIIDLGLGMRYIIIMKLGFAQL